MTPDPPPVERPPIAQVPIGLEPDGQAIEADLRAEHEHDLRRLFSLRFVAHFAARPRERPPLPPFELDVDGTRRRYTPKEAAAETDRRLAAGEDIAQAAELDARTHEARAASDAARSPYYGDD